MKWSEQRDRNADALHDNRLWQRLRLLVTGKVYWPYEVSRALTRYATTSSSVTRRA